MNSTKDLLHQILDTKLSANERAQLRCELAKQLEEAREFEAARDAMGELWRGVGEAPYLEGLDQRTAAEVLLRSGALTGYIGSTKQIANSQEMAKDLISKSVVNFESLPDAKKAAEAKTEIAVCYARVGQLDNARVMLSEALSRLDDQDGDLHRRALLRSAIVEKLAYRLSDALNIMAKTAPLFEASTNHTLKGSFHNEFANVLRRLGEIENCADYIDRAVMEYTAASVHFEQAGNARYQACVENNLALLYLEANRLAEAHEHLDRAGLLFTKLNDLVHQAQVAETRARVMLAEGAFVQAARSARSAVELLENGDDPSLLAEALTTEGIALSRFRNKDRARVAFERAIQVAEQADDLENAGLAAITLVEQLPECLSEDELHSILKRADDRLENTQNAALLRRQKNCFRRFAARTFWPDLPFALKEAVERYKTRHIRRALEESGGFIRPAARLLELSPTGVQKILNKQQKNLRRESAGMKAGLRVTSLDKNVSGGLSREAASEVHTMRILHVENNQMVADAVRDNLEGKGWAVETCSDGSAALERITSDTHYDLLLLDYDLPDVNGIELVHRARQLAHRSRTPIIVLSGTPVEAAARQAGADEFLSKPLGVRSLGKTVTRLLSEREQEV